ncbi:caspase family protein [Methylobacterium haplocladii]|uniref:Caspase family p20 domain-containing protein n=1 Tax=Methylobacterium haplocladii TaxID=1176176 RepID=A0A512INR6_9HYPH|nr:caspase domain-containing protein [Methylobacterium haplocladii]GEO99353.1 hypothetical protein MHA02_17410 [Methylobacterium haplocladii]GJD83445.1 hypothetical protein HPGCJGGD_1312 [Methylobacterium haplocladii]GLS60378.1 hypothetical protein GCM10007887_30570 [Methylobacterium haplocladii]
MSAPSRVIVLLAVLSSFLLASLARAEPVPGGSEKRIALVVGNAAYRAGELATPANDAGLVAQTLQGAGFDVVGARDLDEDSLRRAMRDFTDKAAASGPDTVAFVYLAGYGLQLNGENYFAPVDAQIASAADVPVRALRLSDYKRQLAAIPLKARFVVFDAGRTAPFAKTGDPLAGGLALTEAEPGSLIAFNAAPGTVGPQEKGPYGAYAQALVEMIREGGLPPAELFDRVRLRVSETTQGGEVPWSASRIEGGFEFFKRAADAPPVSDPAKIAALNARPLREIGPQDAYASCLQRDSLQGYQEFVSAYPRDALAKRVRVLIAARREALTWRRTYLADGPDGYWSYLSRYPRGPHAWDARRRLRELAVALEPPPHFAMLAYDVPPPPPEEIVYVERPAVYFDDPYYDLAPPPPPPVFFLPPRPAYIVDLAPPPPVYVEYALPAPAFVPMPAYVVAPAFIVPPPNNVYFENIHNTTVINEINQQNGAFVRDRRGPSVQALGAGAVAGAAAGLAISRVALPPALQQRAALPANALSGGGGPVGDPHSRQGSFGGPGLAPNGQPGLQPPANRPGQPQQGLPAGPRPAFGQSLPGQNGQPLPQQANRPGQPGQPPQGPVPVVGTGQPRQGLTSPNGQQLPQAQANRPNAPVRPPAQPLQPMQAVGPGRQAPGIGPNARPAVGQAQPVPNALPQQPVRPGQPPGGGSPNAAQQQQAAQQRQLLQQQQRAAAQQQANQQRQMQMQQQQAVQQRAAAQQQQVAQQRAVAQQQQAAQQRQMMQQQQQQRAAAQQQMAQQRQMQAQHQQMARPQPQPQQQPHGGGGGRPHCPPGMPCR